MSANEIATGAIIYYFQFEKKTNLSQLQLFTQS